MSTPDTARTWSLRNRLLWMLREKMGGQMQSKQLEAATGIKATHWRDFAAGKQRPTVEMIEAACRIWPQHAFWLATGISDAEYGHIAAYDGDFPQKYRHKEAPAKFFKKAIEALDACITAFDADSDFNDPFIQTTALLQGVHTSAAQLGLPAEHTQKIKTLFAEITELSRVRSLEHDITENQPRESYEVTELRLPERLRQIKTTRALSNTTVESLELQLNEERKRLERHRQYEERVRKAQHGDK